MRRSFPPVLVAILAVAATPFLAVACSKPDSSPPRPLRHPLRRRRSPRLLRPPSARRRSRHSRVLERHKRPGVAHRGGEMGASGEPILPATVEQAPLGSERSASRRRSRAGFPARSRAASPRHFRAAFPLRFRAASPPRSRAGFRLRSRAGFRLRFRACSPPRFLHLQDRNDVESSAFFVALVGRVCGARDDAPRVRGNCRRRAGRRRSGEQQRRREQREQQRRGERREQQRRRARRGVPGPSRAGQWPLLAGRPSVRIRERSGSRVRHRRDLRIERRLQREPYQHYRGLPDFLTWSQRMPLDVQRDHDRRVVHAGRPRVRLPPRTVRVHDAAERSAHGGGPEADLGVRSAGHRLP